MHNYNSKAYLNIGRFLWDALFIAAVFPLAVWASFPMHPSLAWVSLLWMPILYALVFLFSMNSKGLYEVTTFTYQDRTLRGVTSSCLGASVFCLVFLLFMPQTRGNTDFLAFFSLIGVVLMGLRYFVALAIGQAAGSPGSRTTSQLLLAGEPRQMREYLFYLDKTSFRVNPVGFLSENPADAVRDLPRLGSPADLESVLQIHVVDEVVLAWPQDCVNHVNPLLHVCTERGLIAKVALDVWEADGAKCHVHSVGPLPVLIYHRTNLSSLQQSVKRGFDFFAGLACLLVTIPLAVIIIPAILLESKGPALVRLPRIGLHGRPFSQLWFRTTKPGVNTASRHSDDQTRVGSFLFRTKLNHLPSFWNVVKGEMSFVGTRGAQQQPATSDPLYPASSDPLQSAASFPQPANSTSQQPPASAKPGRVPLKPGLTGLWHVRDFDRTLDEAGLAQLDNEFAEQWNLMMDARILLLTPIIFLIHRIIGQQGAGGEKA